MDLKTSHGSFFRTSCRSSVSNNEVTGYLSVCLLNRYGFPLQGSFAYVLGSLIAILVEGTVPLHYQEKSPLEKNRIPPQLPLEVSRDVAASNSMLF